MARADWLRKSRPFFACEKNKFIIHQVISHRKIHLARSNRQQLWKSVTILNGAREQTTKMDGVGRMGSIRSIAESLLPRSHRTSNGNAAATHEQPAPPQFNNLFFQKITNKMDSIMKNCQKVIFDD